MKFFSQHFAPKVNLKKLIFLIFIISFLPLISFSASEYSTKVKSFLNSYLNPNPKPNPSIPDPKRLLVEKETPEIFILLETYDRQLVECRKDKESADNRCLEFNNKGWTDFSNLMGNINDMAGMAMSASCSKLADLLKMGQGAQAGFRAQCAMAKDSCETSCKAATSSQDKVNKKLSAIDGSALVAGSRENLDTDNLINKRIADRTDILASFNCSEESIKPDNLNKLSEKYTSEVQGLNGIKNIEDCENYLNEVKKANTDLRQILNKNEADRGTLSDQIRELQNKTSKEGDENSAASLLKVCSDKAQILAKTSQNIAVLMSSMQQNQACASAMQTFDSGIDLKNCAFTGTCTPTNAANDCADAKYKDSIYCKSYTASSGNRAVTGTGTSSGLTDPSALLNDKGTFGDLSMGAAGVDGGSSDPNSDLSKMGDTASPKSAGVPGGGGSGGLSIPGGGYNPNGKGGGRGAAGDGTSYGGNPSYAGGGNFGSGGSGDKNKDSLDKYLPGAEKDPQLTKKGIGPAGITSPGGLTLFEKVTKSFQTVRTLLMPD